MQQEVRKTTSTRLLVLGLQQIPRFRQEVAQLISVDTRQRVHGYILENTRILNSLFGLTLTWVA